MLDLVIRNARLPNSTDGRLVDIGFEGGRVAAIEARIEADAPAHDAEGCLCCGGLIETHIHLDKSRIVDRCAPEPSRSQPDHMRRVQAVKATFTVEDIYRRAKETLEGCIKHGATRIRTHVEIDEPVGVKGVEALLQLAKEYAWAVDLEICVFPQEGLTTAPAADAALIKGLEMGAKVIGAAPNYDTTTRARSTASSSWRGTTMSTSICTSIPATIRRASTPIWWRNWPSASSSAGAWRWAI